ncbi:unnamed protein product [Nezara viridula]|uniref:Uncharacterized protein n=1 Tax=Nezara viridula TaxID=85310 RepID=A0A9P0HD72_NEZVI|nr:unnamed protein product [Nezara viridula]
MCDISDPDLVIENLIEDLVEADLEREVVTDTTEKVVEVVLMVERDPGAEKEIERGAVMKAVGNRLRYVIGQLSSC